MKAVILAAGLGSRLDSSDEHDPKALTRLDNGKTLLGFQLDALAPYLPLDQVFLVVGYQKEKIMEAFPDLTYIYNPLFKEENTAKSLLRALKKIDDDVLWLNGDVVFRNCIVGRLMQMKRTAMIVNQASVGEEEVKYRTDDQGRILEVSKQVLQPEGEALGINFFTKKDLGKLKECLAACLVKDYFEKGIEYGIQEGQEVWSCVVEAADCAEIDFPEDLVRANQLLKQW